MRRRESIDDTRDRDTDIGIGDGGIRYWIYRQIGQHITRFDRIHRSDLKSVLAEPVQIAEPIPPLAPVTRARRVVIDIPLCLGVCLLGYTGAGLDSS